LGCKEYISNYLSSHADNQFTVEERDAADEHVKSCVICWYHLIVERALKAVIRRSFGIVSTPINVRKQIQDALYEADR
jgi:hypothetical protein